MSKDPRLERARELLKSHFIIDLRQEFISLRPEELIEAIAAALPVEVSEEEMATVARKHFRESRSLEYTENMDAFIAGARWALKKMRNEQ